jgi:hypothetical protein
MLMSTPTERDGAGVDPAGQDGCGRAGEGGVSLARDGEVADDLARACEDRGGADISAVDWTRSNRRSVTSGQHRSDFQAGGAVDWDAGKVRGRGQWALDEGGCSTGSRGARHRLGGDHAGGRMEVDADAAAICRQDQCGAVGDGESGGREWA